MTVTNEWSLQTLPEMDQAQFDQWKALLEERTGMTITEQRKSFLETSIGIRMRELGYSNYQAYYEEVTTGPSAAREWATLVDRLTVQETRFFRHQASFDVVEDFILQRKSQAKKSVEIWSVGCSTGEEAYSLAMLADNCLSKTGKESYFGVTATDISVPALAKARQGIYHHRKLETLDDQLLTTYFEDKGQQHYEVVSKLKERVCFARVNVLELDKAPMHGMDVIFCQNLLIYFRRWRRKTILNRLVERLAPGGLMVLGLGEVVDWVHADLQRTHSDSALAFYRSKASRK